MLHEHAGRRQIARLPEAFAKTVVGDFDAEGFAVFGHLYAPLNERVVDNLKQDQKIAAFGSSYRLSTECATFVSTSALRPADAF